MTRNGGPHRAVTRTVVPTGPRRGSTMITGSASDPSVRTPWGAATDVRATAGESPLASTAITVNPIITSARAVEPELMAAILARVTRLLTIRSFPRTIRPFLAVRIARENRPARATPVDGTFRP